MKYIIIILVASVIFNVKANANDRTAYTNKNKIAMQAIKNMQMRRFGGTIRQPNSERGTIIFLNKQSIVKAEILEGIVKRWSRRYKYVMEITENNVESSNERIVIKTKISELKPLSVTFEHKVYEQKTNTLRVIAHTTIVVIDTKTGKMLRKMPEDMYNKFLSAV